MVHRKGFTIIELLVALALVVFIMSILAEMFFVATQTIRRVKAMGDMAERLRIADRIIRADLTANHFGGGPPLSSPSFWNSGPPSEGFFRVYQQTPAPVVPNPLPSPAYVLEGFDLDGLPSFRASDHMLHFTVQLSGNSPSSYFSALAAPPGPTFVQCPLQQWPQSPTISPWSRFQDPNGPTFNSRWAEVAYFLQPTGDSTTGPGPNLPLFALYRRQRLLVPQNLGTLWGTQPGQASINSYPELSINSDGSYNGPTSITVPSVRFGMGPNGQLQGGTYPTLASQNPQFAGNDVLLSDVISFEVRPCFLLSDGSTLVANQPGASGAPLSFLPLSYLTQTPPTLVGASGATISPFQYGNPNFGPPGGPFGATGGPFVFDTWSQQPITSENPTDYSNWTKPGTGASIPLYQGAYAAPNGSQVTLSIKAIQIVIRVWDYKTLQTRQRTIIQNL